MKVWAFTPTTTDSQGQGVCEKTWGETRSCISCRLHYDLFLYRSVLSVILQQILDCEGEVASVCLYSFHSAVFHRFRE